MSGERMTVGDLKRLLQEMPDEAAVYVHGSNGWGPGAARRLREVERRGAEVHLFGWFL